MRKLFLFTIALLILSCGTDQGEIKKYTYTVINESGRSIKIKSYLTYNSRNPIITNLEIDQKIKKTHSDYPPYFGYDFTSFFDGDSIVIIYGKEKKESFKVNADCNSNERNPLNLCVYREREETFTFTINDFNNAEDCNGDCE